MSVNIIKMRATTYALVAAISCASVLLAGCVPSYTAPRAILHIDLAATEKSSTTLGIAREVAEGLGFEWVEEQDRSGRPPYDDILQCRWLGNTCLYSFDEPKMSLSIVDRSDVDAFAPRSTMLRRIQASSKSMSIDIVRLGSITTHCRFMRA